MQIKWSYVINLRTNKNGFVVLQRWLSHNGADWIWNVKTIRKKYVY